MGYCHNGIGGQSFYSRGIAPSDYEEISTKGNLKKEGLLDE